MVTSAVLENYWIKQVFSYMAYLWQTQKQAKETNTNQLFWPSWHIGCVLLILLPIGNIKKKGNQHSKKMPTTIPSVLAALVSSLNSANRELRLSLTETLFIFPPFRFIWWPFNGGISPFCEGSGGSANDFVLMLAMTGDLSLRFSTSLSFLGSLMAGIEDSLLVWALSINGEDVLLSLPLTCFTPVRRNLYCFFASL